ncbi:uncharacterized protein LOC135200340 [Macrobrachium nipponense]|uniref:uncharacterized protein LOC135200340 n=1 Tax=Macrobrachium nipponense TaxID=159736 RepID=UPI0030C85ED0
MFYGPLAEGEELKLPEDPPEAFKWLLHYIYYGHTNLNSVRLAVKVYHLARKYQMDALVTLCSQFLKTNLYARNLPLIMDTAMLHEDKILLEKCSEVISATADDVFSSSYLGQMNKMSLKHLLQHHFAVRTEVTVFKGLVYWGKAQLNSEVKEPDGVLLRKEIEELLPYIRFLTMTLDEFVKYVMPTGVISAEECNSILMNIKQIPGIPVPPICSRKRKIRKDCVTSRKRSRKDSRRNCLFSSPHSSHSSSSSPEGYGSYSPGNSPYSPEDTPASPENSAYNSANSLYRSPTPENSRHSSEYSYHSYHSSRHSSRSSRHSSRSSRHSSRSSQHSYRSHRSSRSSHRSYGSRNYSRSPSRSSHHSYRRSRTPSSYAYSSSDSP